MSRRLSRQANRLQWKPYRVERGAKRPDIGPRGEVWDLDAALGEAQLHDEALEGEIKIVVARPQTGVLP